MSAEPEFPKGLPSAVAPPLRFRVPPHLREDPKLQRELDNLLKALEANPLLRYNNPALPGKIHRKQLEFNAVKTPPLGTKASFSGNRSGKTVMCVVDDIIQLIDRELVPEHLIEFKKFEAPCDIWIGAPKYSKHEDTIIPLLRTFLPKAELLHGSFDKSYNSHTRSITLASGSTIGLKTYDQDIDAWASAAIHRIHWDEEPNGANGRKLRDEARARLVSTNGDEIISMTPLLGISTWAHDDVYERRHEPQITVMGMDIEDNPWNSPEAIAAFLSGLTAEERKVRKTGAFIHFGGLFFDEFSEDLHVVDPPSPKHLRGQEVVVSIDPGLRHTGVTWIAYDSDNAGLLFEEFDAQNMVVPEVAEEIKRRNEGWGITTEPTYVIDPSNRNLSSSINADEVEAAYAREDIYVQPGQNSRRAGILEIKRRLQATDPEGKPRPTLLFSRACPKTILQAERYRRDPDAPDEWQAVPQDDRVRFDLVDSMRYSIMSRTYFDPEDSEHEEARRRRRSESYEHNFEPALDLSEFQTDAPPMGDAS
jgi:hypothetical protein